MAYENEWETGSGLQLDGTVATVTNVEFGFNANMGAGITCANFTLETPEGDEIEQSFSVGNFEASRDGSSINGRGRINRNSNYGILMESVKEVLAEADENPGEVIGNPREAEGWVGTVWEWGTIERETMNPTTKETRTSSKFVVTAYIGKSDDVDTGDEGAVEKVSALKTKKATAKKAAKKASAIPDGIDEATWTELVEMARGFEDHGEFVDEALDREDVVGDKALQLAVMRTGAGTVWAAR